ncbi:unnamed protein product [Cochlearia groenlandica]
MINVMENPMIGKRDAMDAKMAKEIKETNERLDKLVQVKQKTVKFFGQQEQYNQLYQQEFYDCDGVASYKEGQGHEEVNYVGNQGTRGQDFQAKPFISQAQQNNFNYQKPQNQMGFQTKLAYLQS